NEEKVCIAVDGVVASFHECDIELETIISIDGLKFRVISDAFETIYAQTIEQGLAHYKQLSGPELSLRVGKRERPLIDLFSESPPHVYFADGDMLVGSSLFIVPKRDEVLPFDLNRITSDKWPGVDIKKESQGLSKRADSIQRRVI